MAVVGFHKKEQKHSKPLMPRLRIDSVPLPVHSVSQSQSRGEESDSTSWWEKLHSLFAKHMDIGRKNLGHFLKSVHHRGRTVARNKQAKNIKRVVFQTQVLRGTIESHGRLTCSDTKFRKGCFNPKDSWWRTRSWQERCTAWWLDFRR